MARRNIEIDDVRRVLDNPLSTWSDPANQSRVISGTAANGKTLRVCVVDPARPDGVEVVKTAYWV